MARGGMKIKFERLLHGRKKLKGLIDVIEIDDTLRIMKENGHYTIMNKECLGIPLLVEPHVSNVIYIHTKAELKDALYQED